MGLDHLDIPVGIQRLSDLFRQLHQKVHPKAHIAGPDDGGVAGRCGDFLKIRGLKAGGADDMHRTGLGSEGRKFHRRSRRGEIDHGLGFGENLNRIIADQDPRRLTAEADADILPDPGVTRPLKAARQTQLIRGQCQTDEHPAHPTRNPCDYNSRQIRHGTLIFGSVFRSCPLLNVAAPGAKPPVAAKAQSAYLEGMAKNSISSGAGPSQRQLRVGELIRRTLSDVLARADVHDPDLNRHAITVGEVSLSNDLKVATAYVMTLGGSDAQAAITALARNKGELRHLIGKQLTLKYTPDLRFRLDETFDRLDETRRLFADERVQRDLVARDEDAGDAPAGENDR